MKRFGRWLKKSWFWILCTVVVTVCFTMYGIKTREYNQRMAHAVPVMGEVTESVRHETNYGPNEDGTSDTETSYSVTYKYTFQNETYYHTSLLDIDRPIGAEDELLIYTLDPTVVLSDGNPGIAFMIVGIIFAIPLSVCLGLLVFKGSCFTVVFGIGAIAFLMGAMVTGQWLWALAVIPFGGVALLFGVINKNSR